MTSAKKSFFIFLLILLSCGKTTKPKEIYSVTKDDFSSLEKIQENLIEYRITSDRKILISAKEKVNFYLSKEIMNSEFTDYCWGIKGEIAFLEGNTNEVSIALDRLKAKNKYFFLLKCRLEKSLERKIAILIEGEKFLSDNPEIKLELGLTYFEHGDFKKAYIYMEEALKNLPYIYNRLYGEKRDTALKLKSFSSSPEELKWLLQKKLTFEGMLNLTIKNTDLLKYLNTSNINEAIDRLYKDKCLLYIPEKLDKEVEKKHVAYFLFSLMAKNNSKNIANFYRKFPEKYRISSPIKNLFVNDPWYEAVLFFVEREILEISDGTNFYPDETISGIELKAMLKEIKGM